MFFSLRFLQLFLASLCGLERARVELPLFLQLLCHILLRGGTGQSWWQRWDSLICCHLPSWSDSWQTFQTKCTWFWCCSPRSSTPWIRSKGLACYAYATVSELYSRSRFFNYTIRLSNIQAGLVDTVALLAWTASSLEDGDKHNLATSVSLRSLLVVNSVDGTFFQALAAAQVLTVRNNRGAT